MNNIILATDNEKYKKLLHNSYKRVKQKKNGNKKVSLSESIVAESNESL